MPLTPTIFATEHAAVRALFKALQAKDPETAAHSLRVAEYADACGLALGVCPTLREDLWMASLLHDMGKIGLPDAVLRKSGKLNKRERHLVTGHPELSADILQPIAALERVREIILQHHERFDGTGYPQGRSASEILLESRILAVADAFDALNSSRPYRGPLEVEQALQVVRSEAGRQFCPVVVAAFEQAAGRLINMQGRSRAVLSPSEPRIGLELPMKLRQGM